MNQVAHLAAYAAIVIFAVAIAVRFFRIRHYPVNMRWEIYPIPHEGARSAYGGSKMEETDYWKKNHKPDSLSEMKFMLQEMIFIKALFEHNRKLWWRSFPFHFGLYILAGFIALLGLGAVMQLAGVPMGPEAAGIGRIVSGLTVALGVTGMVMSLIGGIGLLYLRIFDPELRGYSNPSHYFNLTFISVVELMGLVAWWTVDPQFTFCRNFVAGLMTANPTVGGSALMSATILAASVLIAYIPLTHMSHFFVKWFTWHKLRWDDTPNVRGGRIEKMIQEALTYPVTWKADHIKGDGKRTWADVATEEMKQ